MSKLGILAISLAGATALIFFNRFSWRPSTANAPSAKIQSSIALSQTLSQTTVGVAAQNVRAPIVSLMKEPQRSLPPSKVGMLNREEEAQLLNLYRNTTNPLGRFGVTMGLACGGGDATFEAFRNTLENEFRGRIVSLQEESAILLTARSLGLLAPRSAAAWEYLKSGCSPQHWAAIEKWKGARRNIDSYLADYCIQGIGLAGTLEARAFLEELTQRMNREEALTLYGAVLSAAGDLDISETEGRQKFLDQVLMKRGHYDFYEKWKASEKAIPWLEWRDRTKRGE